MKKHISIWNNVFEKYNALDVNDYRLVRFIVNESFLVILSFRTN